LNFSSFQGGCKLTIKAFSNATTGFVGRPHTNGTGIWLKKDSLDFKVHLMHKGVNGTLLPFMPIG
jgi:hypothetical protein